MTEVGAENPLREREKGSTGTFIVHVLLCWMVMPPVSIVLIKGLSFQTQSLLLRNIVCPNKRELISLNPLLFKSVAHHGCSNSFAICLHSAELQ